MNGFSDLLSVELANEFNVDDEQVGFLKRLQHEFKQVLGDFVKFKTWGTNLVFWSIIDSNIMHFRIWIQRRVRAVWRNSLQGKPKVTHLVSSTQGVRTTLS